MSESPYLIARRKRECFGNRPTEVKKQAKPIAKVSDKRKGEMKKYIPEMKKFLTANPYCLIKMKGCKGKAVCVHHSGGRIGVKLHDQADWVPSCAPCNLSVETNDLEAREKGFKKSVHKIS